MSLQKQRALPLLGGGHWTGRSPSSPRSADALTSGFRLQTVHSACWFGPSVVSQAPRQDEYPERDVLSGEGHSQRAS